METIENSEFVIVELSQYPANDRLFCVVIWQGIEWVCSSDEYAKEWTLKFCDINGGNWQYVDDIFPSLWHCLNAIESHEIKEKNDVPG